MQRYRPTPGAQMLADEAGAWVRFEDLAYPVPGAVTDAMVEQIANIIDPHAFLPGPTDEDELVLEIVRQSRELALSKANRVIAALRAFAEKEASGVLVPEAALKWLNGEGPDDEGIWFGDRRGGEKGLRPLWWRTVFNRMCRAARLDAEARLAAASPGEIR